MAAVAVEELFRRSELREALLLKLASLPVPTLPLHFFATATLAVFQTSRCVSRGMMSGPASAADLLLNSARPAILMPSFQVAWI